MSVSKRSRDDADGPQSAKRSKTFSSTALSSSPSSRQNWGATAHAASVGMHSMQEDDAMGEGEYELDSDEDGCCYVPPPAAQEREADRFVPEHPLQWRADPPNTPQPIPEYDSYIPDQFVASTIASTSQSGYPLQQSLFQAASSAQPTFAYPSASNPHPAFPSSYPSHSNPASFTDMNGITRVFSNPNGGEMSLDDTSEAQGYASYGYSHQPMQGQYEQVMA